MSKFSGKGRWVPVAIVLCAVSVLPYVVGGPYRVHILNMIGIQSILSLALNLATGMSGQFNMAIGPLYGVGAYTSTLVTMRLGVPFIVGFISAVAMCAAIAGLVGLPSLKVQAYYLSIITIGLGFLINITLVNWKSLTDGPIGINGVPRAVLLGKTFRTEIDWFWLIFPIVVILYSLASWLIRSDTGLRLRAIRDDMVAARASGVCAPKYQIMIFAISGGLCGVAGSLYAHMTSYVSPDGFAHAQTLFAMTATFVGGLGSLFGPLVGVAVLTVAQEYLRTLGEFQWIVYGAMILLLVLFLPGGVFTIGPKIAALRSRFARRAVNQPEGGRL